MKIPKFLFFASASLCFAVCFTGCRTTVNTVERSQPNSQKEMVADKRIITDSSLNRHVSIVGINETTISTGFTKVQIELLNKSSSAYSFRYRFDWFDDKGMLVQSPTSSWIDRRIQGKQPMSILSVAPTEAAKDFRVQFLSR